MIGHIIYICALFLLSSGVAMAQSPIDVPGLKEDGIGIYIEDIFNGNILQDVNGDLPMIPASITKAVTTASVLSLMSGEQSFATKVETSGLLDAGVLEGNVVIRTVGDPTLESSYFPEYGGFADSISSALKRMGIKEIKGSVVIDQDAVPYSGIPAGWDNEDIPWPYGTGFYSANFRDNKFSLDLPSKKSTPYVPGLKVEYSKARGKIKVDRDRESETIRARGAIPRRGSKLALSTPDPSSVMRHEVMEAILKNGISIGDGPVKSNGFTIPVYTQVSPCFDDIMRSLMFRSDNMMAEGMLRTIAPSQTRDKAIEKERSLWSLRGIDVEGIRLEDGSGLSRNNRMSPYFMADVLLWMAHSPKGFEYASLFPKAGINGTMRRFLSDTSLEGRVALKTGSMKGVQTYAGYMLDEEGMPTHVIVIMANDFTGNRALLKKSLENFLLEIFS